MNKRIKKSWIKALRSGKYEQGEGALRKGDQFCCLGVLCDLHAKATGDQWDADSNGYSYHGARAMLPEAVANWAGINDDDPKLGPRRISKHAAATNDSGKDFSYIADRIEKYL